jgi:uncharacterized protein YkwD
MTSCTKDTAHQQDNLQVLFVEDKENVEKESSVNPSDIEVRLFDMINNHRVNANLSELSFEEFTSIQAEKHNEYMISKGQRSHANFGERAALIAEKVGAEFIAENLASDYRNIEDALEDWLKSPGHLKNIEGDFTHTGLSIKADASGMLYFTQIFYK